MTGTRLFKPQGPRSPCEQYSRISPSCLSILCREDVEKMFSELDKDFDGKLSWREFIGEETTTERAFKLFDENHDGKISKSVMNCTEKNICTSSSRLLRNIFCRNSRDFVIISAEIRWMQLSPSSTRLEVREI